MLTKDKYPIDELLLNKISNNALLHSNNGYPINNFPLTFLLLNQLSIFSVL